jgi:hypothetical protein
VTTDLMTAYPMALPVTLPPAPVRVDRPDRLVIVTDAAVGSILVRWRLTAGDVIWRCSACGHQKCRRHVKTDPRTATEN